MNKKTKKNLPKKKEDEYIFTSIVGKPLEKIVEIPSSEEEEEILCLQTIKQDILNHRKLNTFQIQYIMNLSDSDKKELLVLYIKMMDYMNEIIIKCL